MNYKIKKSIGIKCNAYPKIKLEIISVSTINMFSLTFLFSLNSTNIPIPAFTQRPVTIDPKLNIPPIYISVKITEDAQFGISPTRSANSGWKAELVFKKLAILFSPIK